MVKIGLLSDNVHNGYNETMMSLIGNISPLIASKGNQDGGSTAHGVQCFVSYPKIH